MLLLFEVNKENIADNLAVFLILKLWHFSVYLLDGFLKKKHIKIAELF